MIRLGLVLEGEMSGADAQIYPAVIRSLCEEVEVIARPLRRKPLLVQNAGLVSSSLLHDSRCDHVLIIWDRQPRHGRGGNCATDIDEIKGLLKLASIPPEKVHLFCIDAELESWLFADSRGVDNWISAKTTHRIPSFGDLKTQAEQRNPKERMDRFLRDHFPKWRYNDSVDNIDIFNHLPDLDRVARWNTSFGHLCELVRALCPEHK